MPWNVLQPCCRAVAVVVAALALAGCAYDPYNPVDNLPRVPVAGTVTLDGTPLPQGMIQLDPAPETKGTTVAAAISGGKFAIAKTQGPVPGKYKVKISSRPPASVKPGEAPGGTPKPAPETLPAKYNTESTLEAEVPAGGTRALDFALKQP
jgi:hypothetical protein